MAPPFVGCTSAGHWALLHVGAAPDHSPLNETPTCLQTKDMSDERKYPELHVNIAADPWFCAFEYVGPMRCESAEVMAALHVIASHAGVAVTDHV